MVIFVVFVESYYDYKGTGALLGPPGLPTPAPTGDGVGIPSSRGSVWFPRLLVRLGLPAIGFLDPGGLGFFVDPLKLLRELECFSPYSLWFFEEDASCIDCLVCSPFMWL